MHSRFRRLFTYFVLIPLLFFLLSSTIYAVDEEPPDPCGFANSQGNRNRCCPEIDLSEDIESQFTEGIGTNEGLTSGPVGRILNFAIGLATNENSSLQYINDMQPACVVGEPSTEDRNDSDCICEFEPTPTPDVNQLEQLCERFIKPNPRMIDGEQVLTEEGIRRAEADRKACMECANTENGIFTGIGCIPLSLTGFFTTIFFTIGIGIGGAAALGCTIYSGVLMQVSGGNTDIVQKAREQLTSCIFGLILIIFSVFILRLIGVDILRLPGFVAGPPIENEVENEEDPEPTLPPVNDPSELPRLTEAAARLTEAAESQ